MFLAVVSSIFEAIEFVPATDAVTPNGVAAIRGSIVRFDTPFEAIAAWHKMMESQSNAGAQ